MITVMYLATVLYLVIGMAFAIILAGIAAQQIATLEKTHNIKLAGSKGLIWNVAFFIKWTLLWLPLFLFEIGKRIQDKDVGKHALDDISARIQKAKEEGNI